MKFLNAQIYKLIDWKGDKMTISPISKQQWISIVKNTAIAAAAAFLATVQVVGLNKAGATAGLGAAIAAVAKIIEKSLST